MFAYYIMGKLDKCQQVFEKAIRISKQKEVNIGIHYFWSTMALCYLFKGEFEKADEIAKRFLWGKEAIQDSKGARILFLRVHAFVLYREGKKEKALEFLEEAYELFQNTGLIFEGLPVLVFTRYILERDGKPTEKVDQEIRSHLEKEPRLQAVVEKAEKLNGMLRENGGKADNRVFTDSIFREKIQLSAIIKTSQMISSILNIEELLNVFLEKTLEITGGERGILFLSSGDGSGFEIKKSKNIDKDIFSEKLFEPVFSEVEMNQKGLIWKKENHALFEDFSKLGVKSILVTPLKRRGEVVGILYLDSQLLENLFSEEELDILDVFTSQAAIGIENATFYRRLEEKVRERTQELKNLNRISTLVSSTLDIGKVIEIVYRTFHDFFGIEGIAVQYVDYHEKQIQFMDICVPEIEEERRQKILNIVIPLSPEGGSCAHVVNNRKIVYRKNMPVFSDIQNPYDRIGMEILKHKSVLIFPLEMHGEVIGLIHFFSYSKEFDLSPKDIATIQTYASQVSTAIHNSRLYQELHDEKQNLEELNRELQSAQLQLIQSEKMASLGQLTAGIAHEINNPLSFVINNHFLISDIAGSLKGSQIPDPEKLEDLGLLVSKSRNGLGRIKNIVNNLRSFSRLDEGEDKLVDLNECIESTLGILEHLFKPPVYLDKKMGKIPMVKGSGGKLNQVFMNLIVNGIDALEGEGTITLETFEEDGSVKAVIRDNGAGIPQEIQNRIFDPFFTTKEVGKGTGLGLSISYGIIEKHGGKIRMESSEGEGTAFYLSLPVAGE
jgi:signal transduction histidine kinase